MERDRLASVDRGRPFPGLSYGPIPRRRRLGKRLAQGVGHCLFDGVGGDGSAGDAVHINGLSLDDPARHLLDGVAADSLGLAVLPYLDIGHLPTGYGYGYLELAVHALAGTHIGAVHIGHSGGFHRLFLDLLHDGVRVYPRCAFKLALGVGRRVGAGDPAKDAALGDVAAAIVHTGSYRTLFR